MYVRFQLLTATDMKMPAFSDVTPCSRLDINERSAFFITLKMDALSAPGTSVNI